MRTDRLQREYGVELRWTVFPLHPETPEEGRELSELFGGREEMILEMRARLRRLAEAEGLPLSERSRTYNSRRAQELGKWAEERGKGDPFRMAVYRAYFVEGRNIARVEELMRISEAVACRGRRRGKFWRRGVSPKRLMPTGSEPGSWGSQQSRLISAAIKGSWGSVPTMISCGSSGGGGT